MCVRLCVMSLAVSGAMVAGTTIGHAGSCPQTCFSAGSPSSCSVVSKRDTTTMWIGSVYDWGNAYARYDLAAGTSYVEADHRDQAEVVASDRYTLVGPPPGSSVTIVAHLTLSGYAQTVCSGGLNCAYAGVRASLADSGGTGVNLTSIYSNPILDLPLTRVVGTPFVLTWDTMAYGSVVDLHGANAAVSATLSFDLPPGVGIASCQGYSAGFVTPTSRDSWGAIKIRYR
jgi:hypothetical protein